MTQVKRLDLAMAVTLAFGLPPAFPPQATQPLR